MSHTEAQASELWCPMVRIARREYAEPGPYIGEGEASMIVGGCNTDALGRTRIPASCRCIASECAMWRWDQTKKREHRMGCGYDIPIPDGEPGDWEKVEDDGGWKETDKRLNRRRTGYCGLAGRPEVAA